MKGIWVFCVSRPSSLWRDATVSELKRVFNIWVLISSALASRSGSESVSSVFTAAEGPESWRTQTSRWSRSSTRAEIFRRTRSRISWSSWRRWSTSWRRSTATSRRSSDIDSSTTSGCGWRRGETSTHQHSLTTRASTKVHFRHYINMSNFATTSQLTLMRVSDC